MAIVAESHGIPWSALSEQEDLPDFFFSKPPGLMLKGAKKNGYFHQIPHRYRGRYFGALASKHPYKEPRSNQKAFSLLQQLVIDTRVGDYAPPWSGKEIKTSFAEAP